MTSALAPRDPMQCVEGLAIIARHLRDVCGVAVRFEDLDPADAAVWRANDRALILRWDAPIEKQLDAAIDVWKLFAVGPEVRTGLVPMTDSIPAPRTPLRLVTCPASA